MINLKEKKSNIEIKEEKKSKEEKYEIIRTYLLNRDLIQEEKAGVTATRGFIYQYKAFIYYCLECIENNSFISVVSELGDDITIIGENYVKFIQVKTGKESRSSENLTVGTLCYRESTSGKFDSWLDKLFYQYEKMKQLTDITGIDFEFVIATNLNLSEGVDNLIDLDGKRIGADNTLEDKLNKKVKRRVGKKIEEDKFTDVFSNDVNWYTQKLKIEWLGYSELLFKTILDKIEKIYKVESVDVKKYVVNNLLIEVILRTCNDSLETLDQKEKFEFTIDMIDNTIKDLIEDGKNKYLDLMNNECIKKVFSDISLELTSIIKSTKFTSTNFNNITEKVLIDKLQWILNEIETVREQSDSFIYQRIVNRIFYLNSSKIICSDIECIKKYLMNTILHLVYALTVYGDNNILLEEDIKVFIHSCKNDEKKIYMMIYNGQDEKNIEAAKSEIFLTKRENKSFFNGNKSFQCILVNVIKVDDDDDDDWGSDKIMPVKNEKLFSEVENIKFTHDEDISKIFRTIKSREINIIEKKNELIKRWENLDAK